MQYTLSKLIKVLFVYDISNSQSFASLKAIVNETKIYFKKNLKSQPKYFLITNKIDLYHIKEVSMEMMNNVLLYILFK